MQVQAQRGTEHDGRRHEVHPAPAAPAYGPADVRLQRPVVAASEADPEDSPRFRHGTGRVIGILSLSLCPDQRLPAVCR